MASTTTTGWPAKPCWTWQGWLPSATSWWPMPPQASMGTAIEMWQAFQARVPIVSISPMAANWVIRHLSDAVLPDLDAFRGWVADGGLSQLLNNEPDASG